MLLGRGALHWSWAVGGVAEGVGLGDGVWGEVAVEGAWGLGGGGLLVCFLLRLGFGEGVAVGD